MRFSIYFLLYAIILGCLSTGCKLPDAEELLKESDEITKHLQSKYECHEILVTNYQRVNEKREELNVKLVGCEEHLSETLSQKMINSLRNELEYICSIKIINLTFVYKGEYTTATFYNCNEI